MNLFQNDAAAVPLAAGTVIFSVGDPSAGRMFAVAEGEVDIQVDGQVVECVGAGGVFGEMGLIDEQPRTATAVARTNARVVTIDERRFNFLVQQHPFFALHLLRTLTHRVRRLSGTPVSHA
jgi:CRP-like cAMP-binding protein